MVVAFAVGFLSNRFLSSSTSSDTLNKSTSVQCANLEAAKSSLMSISQKEYLEYAQIKDLKEKYEKADEILGKVMLLFLADVGFKAQKIPLAESVSAGPMGPSPLTAAAILENNKSNEATSLAVRSTPSSPGLVRKSVVINALQTQKQIRDELDKAIIENPKMETAKGQSPTQKQIRILEGRYNGTIKFLDTKRQNLSVTWELIPDYLKDGLSGTFNLNIHGPGTNSESSGHGSIDNIVSLAEDHEGFLVNGCGGRCYLQLYYNTPSDQFFGNYYDSPVDSNLKSTRSGLVELKK